MPWRPSLDWRGTADPRYSTRQRQIGVESPMVRSFIRNGVQGSLEHTGNGRMYRIFLSSFEAVSSCPRTFEEPTTTTTKVNHTITLTQTTNSRQGVPGRSSNPCTTTTTTGRRKHRALSTQLQWCTTFRSRIFRALSHLFDTQSRRRTCEPDDDETTHKP